MTGSPAIIRIRERLRAFKPKTLGGRIYALMIAGGLAIVGLCLIATLYAIDINSRLDRAHSLGLEMRAAMALAQEDIRRGRPVRDLQQEAFTRVGLKVQWRAQHDPGGFIFARPPQNLALPAGIYEPALPHGVRVHLRAGRLSDRQRAVLAQSPALGVYLGTLSREVARLGVDARIEVTLSDGSTLLFSAPDLWRDSMRPSEMFVILGVAVGLALIVLAGVTQRLAHPFTRLARTIAARNDDDHTPLDEHRGPIEARAMAAAYNALWARISKMMAERTRMLAAISHDLRTPGTRLRLRAEFIDDDEVRGEVLGDLDEMDALLNEALDFLSDNVHSETRKIVDFTSLLDAVCTDYADLGRPVSLDGPPPLTFRQVHTVFGGQSDAVAFDGKRNIRILCRPAGLRRAFVNLIENALKYGREARVAIDATADEIIVTVSDKGMGIPEDEWDNVFLPFYRVEGSRARATGGSGLGLAIVKSVIDAHDGRIILENKPEGGLTVTVRLPRRV
ncbi:sensor histidine kinase [Varunaivibrio sulfuroxidans]|uniref:histidine kinase n=1 Tax=Varunaivibrio sulfuroxidans TaxID=1773489 RepID=A0A4R3J7R4_9PROT|nr:ATP-binding protein [Varunaivibrio sulfuroxidans]TCS60953.1 signal transduction histidine kinase [Varunaivibrio sulfuroxidans]WES31641.1 ATP-binding protein [Varunaivibrio sulfuroxidans]